MGRRRLAGVLAACALAAAGLVVALVVTHNGTGSSALPTTGPWRPLTVTRPQVPIIGGGIPVDIDPQIVRNDFSATLFPLPGTNHYRLEISNISNLGVITSLQWYPPQGVHIVKVLGSSAGHCIASGLTGFGGSQFPTIVLYPNILCDGLAMKAPTCTCLGNGGAVSISFVTDSALTGGQGDLRMRTATLLFRRIPSFLK
ncbi:MAG: hypothetical protein JOY72_10185 [Actinobacteria bacterium]|nr:hypothetical protein [Actinomycetota bacterium]MBV8480658.1 hypothetical protein [Actinomycetota bacterium]